MYILLCFGTRPEAIKMAPLYHELKKFNVKVKVCVTAQHREMLDQVLDFFQIVPDFDLDLMQPNQSLNGLSAQILAKIDPVLAVEKPDLVLVHGDTTTSSMVALAAFHHGIKVGHIEAGLRTYNKKSPFPEEVNRQLTSRLADLHFTPTAAATQNLLREGIKQEHIVETGNTVVDALLWTVNKLASDEYTNSEIENLILKLPSDRKLILVTGHRRENFGTGFKNLCDALSDVAERDDVTIVYPVHLNPNVKEIVHQQLGDNSNIVLIPPVSYPTFVWLMQQSFMIVTDSGGIQEEAPTLGKPVLVTRSVSERPEGVAAGFSKLVGTEMATIKENIITLLDNFAGYDHVVNPYGSGDAAETIAAFLLKKNK